MMVSSIYSIIEPPVTNKRRASEIVQRLQDVISPEIFSSIASAYDGARILFSVGRPFFDQASMNFEVTMTLAVNTQTTKKFIVTMKRVSKISHEDLIPVLEGRQSGPLLNTTPVQALNLLLQYANQLQHPVYGKNKFFLERGKRIHDQGLELWKGFYFSLRPTLRRLILNIDMSTAVMYPDGPLLDFVMHQLGERDIKRIIGFKNTDLRGNSAWSRLNGILYGLKIVQKGTGVVRTIKGLYERAGEYEFGSPPQLVHEYIYERHKIKIHYPGLPGIITYRGPATGQFYKKRPDPELMADILNFSKKTPRERLESTKEGYNIMNINCSPFATQSGMLISAEPIALTGRVLGAPRMQYGPRDVEVRNGAWNMLGQTLSEPVQISSWVVLIFERPNVFPRIEAERFADALQIGMGNLGIRAPRASYIDHVNSQNVAQSLQDACNRYLSPEGNPFILIFLPDNGAELKAQIKYRANVRLGIVTQCIRISKLKKIRGSRDQYINNIIAKINPKLGGVNTVPRIHIPGCEWLTNGDTMVVGADVTHASPGVRRPSVASLVASYDRSAAQYSPAYSVQEPRTEIISQLEDMLYSSIRYFNRYRDGVSEGELHRVIDQEISKIKKTFMRISSETGRDVNPKLTFIVVGKRHHIRFFPKDKERAEKSGNAPAGLVVDREITSPGMFDFYLQSHAGILGTSRSSHYIVVTDENNFSADNLQNYCFALCHIYARATRSVSIPAPVYYADILCSQTAYHFPPDMNFTDENSEVDGEFDLELWRNAFQPLHQRLYMNTPMYFL
ncbi:argonaute [Pyrrhoderma noxium]|uniref:Argonaute n=1 Tax=Pyrrhoderma noxium TaxID=2282107 RepID=A0A286UVD5_9AGAM|nr:argonaute [Pyrrhoderma noxium]